MLLASLLKRLALAALLLPTSCATPPTPDKVTIQTSMTIQSMQDYAYYPHALVDEFKKFNLDLKPTEGRVLETAVMARIRWDISKPDSRCDLVLAFRRTGQWLNYAWASDGELINSFPTWWGEAQKSHRELQDESLNPPNGKLTHEQANPLDVLWDVKPLSSGQALIG